MGRKTGADARGRVVVEVEVVDVTVVETLLVEVPVDAVLVAAVVVVDPSSATRPQPIIENPKNKTQNPKKARMNRERPFCLYMV